MRQRCANQAEPSYPNYGGRGIYVCERWRDSFANFLADMGPRPAGTSIDRIDNDGPYSKLNCRWATQAEQARNTRHNHRVEHDGETLCIAEWSERVGIPGRIITQRLGLGWSAQRALTTPVGGSVFSAIVERDGISLPVAEWAKLYGLTSRMVHERMRRGWSVERALNEPRPPIRTRKRSAAPA